MQTIEQLLKFKLKEDLSTLFPKMNVIVTNDLSMYFDRNKAQGNELVALLQTGNGMRSVSDNGGYITQSLAIYMYVNVNNLQDVLSSLTQYTKSESIQDNVQILGENEYSLYINYNTPSTDGMIINVGIYSFTSIVLMGTMIYSDIANMQIGIQDKFYIGDAVESLSELTNILENNDTNSPILTQENVQGSFRPYMVVSGLNNEYNFNILYDPQNALHVTLYNLASANTGASLFKYMKVNSGTPFKVLIVPTRSGSAQGFKFINLKISRVGG